MKTCSTFAALLLAASLSHAAEFPETVQKPVSIGDSWTFKRTGKGEHVNQSRILFKIAQQGPANKYVVQSLPGEVSGRGPTAWRNAGTVDMDTCMIDFFGGGSLGITDSCNTTFVPGMDWNTEEIDKDIRTIQRHQVIGPEEVTVAAGTFMAIKIESHWEVAKITNPGKTPAKYGPPLRHHFLYWYVQDAKTMVKTEREFRNIAGAIDMRSTDELEAFRVQKTR
jgi:hypothetical protein